MVTTHEVADRVLQTCLAEDTTAKISSVLRDSEGRTVVKIRTDPRNEAARILGALQSMWPLAQSSVSENALDGIHEAEITIPRAKDEKERAWRRARRKRAAELLLLLSYVLLCMALFSYLHDCKAAFATAEPGEL